MTLRWGDMTLQDKILGVKTRVLGGFQALGPSKSDSPEKMLSNEPLKSEIGDFFFCGNFGRSKVGFLGVSRAWDLEKKIPREKCYRMNPSKVK